MSKKALWILVLILIAVGIVSVAAAGFKNSVDNSGASVDGNGNTVCTMDAMMCPDGTSVGRVGPNCEFAACPDSSNENVSAPNSTAPTTNSGNTSAGATTGGTLKIDRKVIWIFTEAKPKNDIPQTSVTVDINSRKIPLGTYEGSCSISVDKEHQANSSERLLPKGSISGVVCWYAGGGISIDMFDNGKTISIKKATIDEGTAEGGGGYGPYETIVDINY